ncbi:hypothetical protein DA2_0607 [Desulfovibrio sp. A2]|nr:hypothetical protein DA2_0607 [Desulfovibrio sp. A2]
MPEIAWSLHGFSPWCQWATPTSSSSLILQPAVPGTTPVGRSVGDGGTLSLAARSHRDLCAVAVRKGPERAARARKTVFFAEGVYSCCTRPEQKNGLTPPLPTKWSFPTATTAPRA